MIAMSPSAICQLLCILQTSASSAVLDSSQRKNLDADSEMWFHLLVASTVVVGIGLLFEFPEVKHEWQKWWRNRPSKTKWLVPKPDRNRIPLWSMIGFVLVMGGVAAEGIFEGCMGIADTKLRNFDKQSITDTELKAARLGNSTQELKTAAEVAKGQAESERLARVKIEASVAFRRLTDIQKVEMGSQLRRMPPEPITVWFFSESPEGPPFAADIAEMLRKGGMYVYPPRPLAPSTSPAVRVTDPIVKYVNGVQIGSTSDTASVLLANKIKDLLEDNGFDAEIVQSDAASAIAKNIGSPNVIVGVMSRPEGPQGEYKLQAEREAKQKKKSTAK